MPNSSTNRGRSRGTARSSQASRTSNKNSKEAVNISKFFTKKQSDEDLSDSPYKNCISEVKDAKLGNSASDLDDFKTPETLNKVSKISQQKHAKKRKKSVQVPLSKFLEDNFRYADCDADHLQTALAMSESSYASENPSSHEKLESFKKVFEKYGLIYPKNKAPGEMKMETSKNKKSRYKYITPIIKIRTQAEREELISSKVSLILAQNCNKPLGDAVLRKEPQVFCNSFRKYMDSKIFHVNQSELSELNKEGVFHVSGLGIEAIPASCGSLLKDWRRIPGREPTPERENESEVLSKGGSNFNTTESSISRLENSLNSVDFSPTKIADQNSTENSTYPIEDPSDQGHALMNSPKTHCSYISPKSVNTNSSEIVSPNKELCTVTPPTLTSVEIICRHKKTSKYRLSPDVQDFTNDTIIITPPRVTINSPIKCKTTFIENSVTSLKETETPPNKSNVECLSPDLFESDDELHSRNILKNKSLEILSASTHSRVFESGSAEEMECYDLTQSDEEEGASFPRDSMGLDVTEYVMNLLKQQKEVPDRRFEKISTSEEDLSQPSQETILSDEELNYSSVFATPQHDIFDEENKIAQKENIISPDIVNDVPSEERIRSKLKQCAIDKTPQQMTSDVIQEEEKTPNEPENGSYIIKTSDVTPMANYDEMDTPKIVKELDKFGLKPLKRQKGAKLLRYIYESTHPVVEDEDGRVLKKRRTRLEYPHEGGAVIGDVGEEEDLIFERAQSKKVASCRVPLHIVWYNFVMSNPKIRESILLYEPLQLEVLHSMMKDQGFKFNIQDLLTFLDRKCITIRTAQGSHHGKVVNRAEAS